MANPTFPPPSSGESTDSRSDSLQRLKFDLSVPARWGLATIVLGLVTVYGLEKTLNLATVLAISLHFTLFTMSVILAAYTFKKGHDQTPKSDQIGALLVRAAVPYRSRTLLLAGAAMLVLTWTLLGFHQYSGSKSELESIEHAFSNALESSDQAVILSKDEARDTFQTSSTLIRGAGATWLNFFLGIEARHRLPPHESEVFFYPAGSTLSPVPGSANEEGLVLFPLGTEGHFVSANLKQSLEGIRETKTYRMIGLSAMTNIQLFSILLLGICIIAMLKHQEDRVNRDLLFRDSEKILQLASEKGSLRSAPFWAKLLTLEPFLCEFVSTHTPPKPGTFWVTFRHHGDSPNSAVSGKLVPLAALQSRPSPIRLVQKKLERNFFVPESLFPSA